MSANMLLDWAGPFEVERHTDAVEAAYIKAAKRKYGSEYIFWARLDDAGDVEVAQVLKIVEDVEDERREVKLANVTARVPDARLGGYVINKIDLVEPDESQLKEAQTHAIVKNVNISLT